MEWVKNEFGVEIIYINYKDMIDIENIDVIFIVVLILFYLEMMIYVMNVGLNVFCEKLLGFDFNEVDEMVKVIKLYFN